MRITLSIMINTVSACGEPLTQILELLRSYEISATFFVSTGTDHALPWARRLGGRGEIRRQAESLLAINAAGHDVGMSSHDPQVWSNKAAHADASWVREQWRKGVSEWSELFGEQPQMHAAANYQLHPELFACEQDAGLKFASDTRGQTPFYPVMMGVESSVLQLPVTVASPEEMMRIKPNCLAHLHEELFDASLKLLPQGQHWRIVAGHDDLRLVEKLIVMWRGTSKEFISLTQIADFYAVDGEVHLHRVGWQEIGTTGHYVAAQSLPLDEEI
jgi:undecaprenyl phosphate-alpha-L-ara4FN deformylase